MTDEFKDSGGQNAISIALLAAVHAHPDPRQAARAALNAVEAEKVQQLYNTQQLSEWGRGFDEAHDSLVRILSAIADQQQPT